VDDCEGSEVGDGIAEDKSPIAHGESHQGSDILTADRIFLLMKKEYRLSRNTRALWYFSHMDSVIHVQNRADLSQFTGDLDVVSVMPQEPVPAEWDWDTGHLYKYKVSSASMVTFLSRQYRFVYMLDFSPSAVVSDIKKDCILVDQMLKALKRSLEGAIRPFTVPGSQVLFTPDVYVTVIGWTPFLCPGAQAVIHQGWLVTPETLNTFIAKVADGLHKLEDNVSKIASYVIDELETIKLQSERIVGDLFEESVDGSPMAPSVPMAAPDTGFVNMIQTGMLALQLLPDNSSASILVITDGVLNVPDVNILDALLNQLRSKSICLSFLQVSSSYHPHSGFGYCPYNELMTFMALATSGAFLSRVPEILIEPSEPYLYEMNQYHEAFLAWSFRKCLEGIEMRAPILPPDKDLWRKGRYTEIRNSYFTSVAEEGLICKKRLDMMVNTNLTSILSCRLREGYTVNSVRVVDKEVKVRLTLPWKYHTFIHYTVFSVWPATDRPESSRCRVEVSVEGPYDIIYDIICQATKQFSSHYRNSVIKKFYMTLQQLNQTDKLLVHLNSFASNASNYTLPDTIRNGLPLFTMSTGTVNPVLYSQDTNPSFVNFWRPIFSLDINIWHRWMHTHRICVLLQHDQPLPKHLLMSSSTGRYHSVLCKKAASKVAELIKSLSAFCLLDNHSYISFLRDEQGHPVSFYVIKVTSKPPCLVVWVAFLGGIPGSERHKIVSELTGRLAEVTMKQRVTWRDLPASKIRPVEVSPDDDTGDSPSRGQVSSAFPDVYACLLLNKPVERFLVRYENVPSDYCSLLGPIHGGRGGGSPVPGQRDLNSERSKNASAAFLTLSRYLHHQRWIYKLQSTPCAGIPPTAVSRILNTICKARIQEGFTFAYSSKGIQNMVLEVPMLAEHDNNRDSVCQTCVIQCVIFPPHITTTGSTGSVSEDDFAPESVKDNESTEADGEVQIILEVWTEPQDGTICLDQEANYLQGHRSYEVASQIFPKDLECVSTLVTFEHLIMMCQNPCIPSPLVDTCSLSHIYSGHDMQSHAGRSYHPADSRQAIHSYNGTSIHQVPFAFDLLNLLPKAHQTEMIFSLFIQELTNGIPESAFAFYNPMKSIADRPNEMLFDSFIKELDEASDRELSLSSIDCVKLPEMIGKRRTSNFNFQTTNMSGSCRPSFHSSSRSSHQQWQKCDSATTGVGASRRFPSGNSACSSSMTDTYRDLHSQQDCSTSECYPGLPKWRCFLKAISPTHMVLTLIPATYEDLKSLTLSQDTLDGKHPDIIDIITKALPTDCRDSLGNLDDISVSSSIPNLETVVKDIPEVVSPRLDNLQSSRQRSGSDVFEMNRPKLPTVRKSSGEPAIMRDRTVSLDGLSQFKAKALLRKKLRLRETRDRERTDSLDTKNSSGQEAVLPAAIETRRKRYTGPNIKDEPSSDSLSSPSPLISLSSKRVVGSIAFPIYIYDCNILGLTNNLVYSDSPEKPRNYHSNLLFKPEISQHKDNVSSDSGGTTGPVASEHNEQNAHIDKDVKHWIQIIKMIYFKSYVNVLFRSLQLKLPIHSYDIKQAVNYCDNDTSCDIELEAFVKEVCPHQIVKHSAGRELIDIEAIKNSVSCIKGESWHKCVQKKFSEIVNSKFKIVPGMSDIFFFCPPGLDFGEVLRIGSRRQDETKSSESTSRRLNSDRQKDDDDDKTIEFRSIASQQSLPRLTTAKQGTSMTETEIETGRRDVQSSLSSVSHFEQEWDSDDDDLDRGDAAADEFSPPLFIQFSFSISQNREDIVSVPVNYLPSCLCEIFQDKNIPDPEQDIGFAALGLRIDIVCMTLPKGVRTLTDNIGGLRSTSLCSTMSCRDSRSMMEDNIDIEDILEDDVGTDSDALSHLPTYQHKAVMDIKEELNWMLMDERAFALSKSPLLTFQTLDFISTHVQASTRERPGSMMETIDLEFVFGSEKSMGKFKELFGKITVQGFLLKKEGEFYYLDRAPVSGPPMEEFTSNSKRKSMRLSRPIQLSPVKESLIQMPVADSNTQIHCTASVGDSIATCCSPFDSGSSSDRTDPSPNLDLDLKLFIEKGSVTSDWHLIIKIEQERVLMFVHYREQNEFAISTWKNIQTELKGVIREICVKVNQDLLLKDLHDNRRCNRLLEAESNEDVWRDSNRRGSLDDGDDDDSVEPSSSYLEANMNMRWAPGRFQCPEVWRTTFSLHPRLKYGQTHSCQSWGVQAIKTVLVHNMVSNRSDMFVYMDDNKNIFYIKLCEQVQSSYSHPLLSRQTSIISKEDESSPRTSSIGSFKQLKKTGLDAKDDHHTSTTTSRSNSVGEADRGRTEDHIIFKVFGIEEVGKNIKEDLTAVLQKKLDDKVVEVISMMLKRNSRCKLATEDVLFLQKPNAQPTSLRFRVHLIAIPYLPAIMYYLKQNLVQVPSLIQPNYMAGSTRRLRDAGGAAIDGDSAGQHLVHDLDTFIYNDHNEKGGRNGIACLSLSLVDGMGNPVAHCAHPLPRVADMQAASQPPPGLASWEEMVQTELYTYDKQEEEEVENKRRMVGPGPMALIRFKIWESGRVDTSRLCSLLETSIRHALWDAVLEFKLLPVSLCLPPKSTLAMQEQSQPFSIDDEKHKLIQHIGSTESLPATHEAASSCDPPHIIVRGSEANEELPELLTPNNYEQGDEGTVAQIYQSTIWTWFAVGKELEVPSYQSHSVDLVSKHEMHILLRETSALIKETVPSLDVKLFRRSADSNQSDRPFTPVDLTSVQPGADCDYFMVGRHVQYWKHIVQERPNLSYLRQNWSKHSQYFPSFIQSLADQSGTYLQTQGCAPLTPSTPVTPGVTASPGLSTIASQFSPHGCAEMFVPRQILVIARVTKRNLYFHFYNLSRDCTDRLVSQSTELGAWFTARSSLLTSIVAQKLGLFHHQTFLRAENQSLSRHIGNVAQVEHLARSATPTASNASSAKSKVELADFQFVYRNAKIAKPYSQLQGSSREIDLLKRFGKQITSIWNSDAKQHRQLLYMLWDSRGENLSDHYTEDLIKYFKQKARMLHYVFTPLLFLPEWRRKANETRDQGVEAGGGGAASATQEDSANSTRHPSHSGFDKTRHSSGGLAAPREPPKRSKSITSQSLLASPTAKSPVASPKTNRVSLDEKFHCEIVANYIQEYEQYLQSIGFTLLNIRHSQPHPRRSGRPSVDSQSASSVPRRRVITSSRSRSKVVYLQKFLRGGLLVFEVGISEPFFYTKLHALEAQRLRPRSRQGVTNKNFMTTFLEDCDNVKILIHLHSFTYDYHLRTISSYIGQKTSQLRKGFHVVSFLEDFMKYYSKGPNFARNFVYTGSLHIISQGVSPLQLYNYLLSHEKQYNMEVIRMEPVFLQPNEEFDTEFVLVQVSSHKVTFRDNQDAKRVDEFDVSLLISYDACPNGLLDNQKSVLSLKYFVLMTSKRDLLPMREVEKKEGNFRAVVSSVVTQNLLKVAAPVNPPQGVLIPRAPTPPIVQTLLPAVTDGEPTATWSVEKPTDDNEDDSSDSSDGFIKSQLLSKLTGIRRESVNYVGYYSAHEETMKMVMQSQAKMAEEKITLVVRDAMVDCRRDQLWHRLITNTPPLLFSEFVHLTTLVHSETLDELDPRLAPLLNKPTGWYDNLSKLVQSKYSNLSRQFCSSDGQIKHTIILTEGSRGTFALVSVDFFNKEGCLAIVYREPQHTTQSSLISMNSQLLTDFVELCCFHLWTQLL